MSLVRIKDLNDWKKEGLDTNQGRSAEDDAPERADEETRLRKQSARGADVISRSCAWAQRGMNGPEDEEKPFASLVTEAETTDQPSERADLKEEEEEADLDKALLTDDESEEEEDVVPPVDEGEWIKQDAEKDPFTGIPGSTSVTTLRATAQACQRGLAVKKVDSSNNFEVSFDLILKQKHRDRRGVAHFAVGGALQSQVPRVCVAPNSTRLFVFVRQGSFRMKLVTPELPLRKMVRFRFRLVEKKISVDINDRVVGAADAEEMHVPVPAKLFSYLNGPGDKSAEAMVGAAVYRWRHYALRPKVQATTIFELPPDEIQLMKQVTDELKKAKSWATFDSIFGLIVVSNAIAMGIRTDCLCGSELLWQIMDNVFLVAFIVEFSLRAVIIGIRQFGATLLTDSWLQFDAVVVCISILDTWVLGGVGSGGVYALARLYRLLKLVKMVRVLRAFRNLAMLVEGVLNSLQTLVWAVLLLAMGIFILGVLLVTISKWDEAASLKFIPSFTSLPEAMWTLLQIATFDGWVELLKKSAFGIGGLHGTAIAVVVLLSACILGLGLMNLVVGILCNTAFKLENRQVRTTGAERLVSQQEALDLLRQQLFKHGTHLLKNNRLITKAELQEALEDTNLQAILGILELNSKDFDDLAAAFEEDGNVEIDGLIEAIGIIELQSYFSQSVASSVKRRRAVTALRPVDLLFFVISLRQLEASMSKIERSGRNLCAFAYDVLSVLYLRAEKSFTLLRLTDVTWAPPRLQQVETKSSLNVAKMEETANQFNLDSEEGQLLMPIDVLFGSLIVINGAFVGIQAAQDDDSTLIYWIDLGFTLIFTIEFILRGVLAGGLAYVYKSEETDTDFNFFEQAKRKVKRFNTLKASMRCYIFPPCPPGGVRSVVAATCHSLKEFSVLFDFLIIALSLLDSLIIVQLRNAGALDLDTSALSVLRAFRLFRLAKLLRVFRLFPQLQKMVFALIETWRQVCWALLLILLLLYAFSIYAVSIVGHEAAEGTPSKMYFGDLRSALLTGWQITTFDHWDEVLYTAKDNMLHLIMLLLLSIVLGLGLMNMVIGVLCESALALQARDEADLQRGELITFLTAMKDLQEASRQELGDQELSASMLERATGLKMHPKHSRLNRGLSERSGSKPSLGQANAMSLQQFQPLVILSVCQLAFCCLSYCCSFQHPEGKAERGAGEGWLAPTPGEEDL